MNSTVEPSDRDHERKDIDVVSLFTIVLILFVSCGIILSIVAIMMHYFSLKEPAHTAGQPTIPTTRVEEFPPPHLEIKPGASLAELRAGEEADLNSYGWVDRKTETIRIPIDRAMQLILARGLPDVGAGKTPLSLMQARPAETATPPGLMQRP